MSESASMNSKETIPAVVVLCEVCKIKPARTIPLGQGNSYQSKTCAECAKKINEKRNQESNQKWIEQRTATAKNKIARLIPPHYSGAKIDDIESCIREIIDTMPFEKGLFLYGPPGRGKSHILYALAKKHLESGINVAYWSWEKLLIELRDERKNKKRKKQIIDELTHSDLLILDDIGGVGKTTTYEMTTLFVIFDGRIENNGPTYFASNREPKAFADLYDGRIYSRILGHCELINITGQDRRLKMKSPFLFDINKGTSNNE